MDGPGLRTAIYFAGCQHFCPGCQNPGSWDFGGGEDYSVEQLMEIIRYNRFPVTFSGGDPLYQAAELVELARQIRLYFGMHPEYLHGLDALWVYTGFEYERVRHAEPYRALLDLVDVVVDGPFLRAEKPVGPALRFRGSANQRFIRCANDQDITAQFEQN